MSFGQNQQYRDMKTRVFARKRKDVCGDVDVFEDALENIHEDVKVSLWQWTLDSLRVNV